MPSVAFPQLESPSSAWKAASGLYYEDKVIAAQEIATPNAGAAGGAALRFYRMIEGEAETRKNSEQAPLSPWLNFEWVSHEVPHHVAVSEVILHAASKSAERLKWDKHESVLATILVAEADADWNEARYGYCVDKLPYDKICLPQVSTHDPNELWRVTAHEFAHVVVLNTAMNLAPHWLDEGIACTMEGRDASQARQRLRQGNVWMTPGKLGGAFDPDRRDPSNMHMIRAAYDQGTVLVGYLHSLKGDAGLVELLRAFTEHSRWKDLLTVVSGRQPVDVALKQTFGFESEELFERASR